RVNKIKDLTTTWPKRHLSKAVPALTAGVCPQTSATCASDSLRLLIKRGTYCQQTRKTCLVSQGVFLRCSGVCPQSPQNLGGRAPSCDRQPAAGCNRKSAVLQRGC